MVAGLVALLALLFFGGGYDTILLNPDMEKGVKTYVTDKNSVKEIHQIIKQTGKKQESFTKDSKKGAIKSFEELNLDYHAKRDDFQIVLDEFFTGLANLQKESLDSELKVRSLITEEEWNKIMDDVVKTPEKGKVDKQIEKITEQMKEDLIKACQTTITDSLALLDVTNLADEYKVKSLSFARDLMDLGYKDHESIRKYDTPREDFESLALEVLNHRKSYMNYILDLRFLLKDIVSPEAWPDLAKSLNKGITQ